MNLPLRAYWQLLSKHIRPQKVRFGLLTLFLLSSIGLRILNPQIMRVFIDSALAGEALSQLTVAALAFLGIALLQQGLAVSVAYLGENVAWTATNALRAELAEHALHLDMRYHNDHTPGELIERIDGDVTEMASFFSQFVVKLIGNGLLLVGILVVLFFEDWRLGLGFSLFAVLAFLILNQVRNLAMPHQKARRQAEADLFGFVEEQLTGAEDIRASGAVDFSIRDLYRLQTAIWKANRLAQFKRWIMEVVIGVMMVSGNILAISSGYFLFTAGAVTIGTVYLIIHYMNLIEEPIWAFTREIESFQTIGACVERLHEFRRIQPQVRDGSLPAISPGSALDEGMLSGDSLSLKFDQVSFSYHGDDRVINDLTFNLAPGVVLGLLGRTGSGKTTLARLIFRLYDPTAGGIYLGGVSLRDLRLEALRCKIAIVTQDVQLFRASVRDNLTFFDRSLPDERILEALDQLELGDWRRSLPNGLDTMLGAGGRSLSAGEAQLLAFTRAFLRDPGLVILDEASSRMDPTTEQRLERAVDKLLHNRTAIIIAHRLGTVHRADEIMILDTGRIVEHGRRKTLAADPGSQFYHLLQTGLEEVLA